MNLKLGGAKAVVLASALYALGTAPLAAQSSGAAAPPPGNVSDIGPGELSNFSLNGTVTRPVVRPPAAQPAAPVNGPATSPAPRDDRPAVSPTTSQPASSRPDPAGSDLFRRPPTLPDTSAANGVVATPRIDSGNQPANVPALASEGFTLLPWLVALLAVVGAGVMFFGRRRQQRYGAAGNAPIDITRPDPVPAPVPGPRSPAMPVATSGSTGATAGARRPLPTTLMPPPPAPTVQPKADPVVPRGIVSTGLRPWIEVELSPDRALLDEAGVAIAFEVTLFNSGSAAARDVIIEARLFNAGARQDVDLSAFFTNATAAGDPIPQIAPYARIPLRSAVRLPLAEIREYEIEGRKLFVPMVAISVRYRWSRGDGQSAAGFLVGQGAEGQEKLAPLRLDRGARSWRGLGARRYEKGLRS